MPHCFYLPWHRWICAEKSKFKAVLASLLGRIVNSRAKSSLGTSPYRFQALCISREQHFYYRPVIDVISGAIFLGSPQLVSDTQEAKRTLDLLLRCRGRGIGRSLSSDGDLATVVDICRAFERVNLKVPVISVYESKEAMTQAPMFAKLLRKDRNFIVRNTLTVSSLEYARIANNHLSDCHKTYLYSTRKL